MLEARSVAVVGASPRPGSFGRRMVGEACRSTAAPRVYLVNPRYTEVLGRPCLPSLDEVPEPVDLVLLGVPDAVLTEQLARAAARADRSAVVFGSAYGADPGGGSRTERLAAIARDAGMALCGAGCMGFVNVAHGLRAVGYVERDPLPAGPVALVTHSGSVFSALLRNSRGIGFSLAVSSGMELVTTTAQYLEYALDRPETRVVALLLETVRQAAALRAALRRAAANDVPVVLLPVGRSARGRVMVAAHSGALAGDDAVWGALADDCGVALVSDAAELADTVELLAGARRPGRAARGPGLASVHDSGAERALLVDLAEQAGVPLAELEESTKARLAGLLEPGLAPNNPLDVWGTGSGTRERLGECMAAMAADPAVGALALAVDLTPEYDGDESYPLAAADAAGATDKPVVVLSHVPAALDRQAAAALREAGIPVLEGTRSGLVALRHLLVPPVPAAAAQPPIDRARQEHWAGRLGAGPLDPVESLALLAAYGICTAPTLPAATPEQVLAAAHRLGWPVVLKTARLDLPHKSDAGGVITGLADPAALAGAYAELAGRLGPQVTVAATAPAGVELALGMVDDPTLGPLLLVAAGGVLIELLADRALALPPLDEPAAARLLGRVAVRRLLDGGRGRPPADVPAVLAALVGMSTLAVELGGQLAAVDVNPLICGPAGAVAVDALVLAR